MTENEWTKTICDKLTVECKGKGLECKVLKDMPYAHEILSYHIEGFDKNGNEIWTAKKEEDIPFETDLVIYEKDKDIVKPRVIIESKIKSVTTHDAITYSYKAEKHKSITPYLRYGIMLGDRGNYPLPGRLFRHGTNFDFMFSFSGEEPTKEEWDAFIEMISCEIKYSKQIEEMLTNSRKKSRKNYYMLQKKLELKEH